MLLDHDPAHAFMPYPAVDVPHALAGPLAGLTFAVKDLFDVAGYPTSGGNPLLLARSGIKAVTAPTVSRLLAAGARCVGKTITDELAFSMNGQNAHFGAPRNGGAPDRIAGGSSSGSAAAVSNDMCDFALGTDTGGSVRAPASHCGLYGLRPTHGRISLAGCLDLAPSFDTCGFFARNLETFTRVGDVLLGADGQDGHAQTTDASVRLVWPTDVWSLVEPDVRAALDSALRATHHALGASAPTELVLESFDAMYWAFRYIQGREAWQVDGAFIERDAPPLGPGVAERFAWSRTVSDAQFDDACAFRARFRTHLAGILGPNDVVIMPTMPDVAPLRCQPESALEDYRNRAIRMLCISGLSGYPQLSMPLASRLGAPLGVSLLGPAGSDRRLIALAAQIRAAFA